MQFDRYESWSCGVCGGEAQDTKVCGSVEVGTYCVLSVLEAVSSDCGFAVWSCGGVF